MALIAESFRFKADNKSLRFQLASEMSFSASSNKSIAQFHRAFVSIMSGKGKHCAAGVPR